jgi:signal transduction histidine kinase
MLAPTPKDAAITESILSEARIPSRVCHSLADLARECAQGAAVLLVAEEAILGGDVHVLADLVEGQPPWSDLPILLLTWPGADSSSVNDALDLLGNVTLIERPVRVASLVTAIQAALRARERQYQIRGHLQAMADANQRKDEFLATLAHELRNPLAPIRNSVHVLQAKGSPDPEVQHLHAILERQVGYMVRLVDDLLEISRITRGKIELRQQPTDLDSILQNAIETSQPLIEQRGQRLRLWIAPEVLPVFGDPVRLAQVFSNLLNNAAKYSHERGEIWLIAERSADEVAVTVRDSGVGIDPDELPRVFEIFTQAETSRGRSQGGLGIGLAIVQTLVRMHGGPVEARSAGLGRGSEFTVRLPVLKTAPTRARRTEETVGADLR